MTGLKTLFLLVGTLVVAGSASRTDAAVLITHGDTIKELGEPKTPKTAGATGGLKVGYKYSYFGLFWCDLWTWGGEYCLFIPKEGLFGKARYEPISQAQAAEYLGTPADQLPKPFLYSYPLGLLIIGAIVALSVVVGIGSSVFGKKPAGPVVARPGVSPQRLG